MPQNHQNFEICLLQVLLWGPMALDNPYLKKFLGLGGAIRRCQNAPKPPNFQICLLQVLLWGPMVFDNPYLRKFLGLGGAISRFQNAPKPPKFEICLLQVLLWGPMVFNNPSLRKFLGLGCNKQISKCPKTPKISNLLTTGPFVGTHGF